MKLRTINIGLLFWSGIVYRIVATLAETVFLWIIIGEWKLAICSSIVWNIINTTIYYVYHYFFARMFKLGKNNGK